MPITNPYTAPVFMTEGAASICVQDICRYRCNTLLVGPQDATEHLLMLLRPYLHGPTVWKGPQHAELELPPECRVLVLQNVSALSAHDQATIGRWLDTHRTQLISTNTQPLFPLIALGLFDEALYYRLNVMLLGVGLAPPSRLEEEADMSSLR